MFGFSEMLKRRRLDVCSGALAAVSRCLNALCQARLPEVNPMAWHIYLILKKRNTNIEKKMY